MQDFFIGRLLRQVNAKALCIGMRSTGWQVWFCHPVLPLPQYSCSVYARVAYLLEEAEPNVSDRCWVLLPALLHAWKPFGVISPTTGDPKLPLLVTHAFRKPLLPCNHASSLHTVLTLWAQHYVISHMLS